MKKKLAVLALFGSAIILGTIAAYLLPIPLGKGTNQTPRLMWSPGTSPVGMTCHVRGALPDPACTPGMTLPVTAEQVCVPGYARSVRNVPQSEKDQVYAEYGITQHAPGAFEVDHLVSLELGGSNDLANLWPESYTGPNNAHDKDKLENALHAQVCAGTISLAEAQTEIATNWLSIFHQVFGGS